VTILFVLCFLDRVNLSFAALDMTRALGFSASVYGLGAGMFFWGYLLFEIPGARLVERSSARLWIGVMLIAWGAAASLMGALHTVREFYACRIILGVAEAGFFPGIVIYLSRWFPRVDRARAIASLAVGLPAANLIGAPLSGWLLGRHWGGLDGWRWVFIAEGLPSVVAGIVTMLALTDHPRDARWLTAAEKAWLEETLARERAAPPAAGSPASGRLARLSFAVLVLIWFFDNAGVYGFNLWLPMMLRKASGYPSSVIAALASIPFIGALAAAVFVSRSSDASGERRWHTALPMIVFGCGLALSVACAGNLWLSIAALCVAALGLTSGTPAFWALATSSSSGSGATPIAIITSAGAIGGMCGPYLMGYLRDATGSFEVGVSLLALFVVSAGVLGIAGTR
jgi:ACS family tartrate transporter-like MFS transporter